MTPLSSANVGENAALKPRAKEARVDISDTRDSDQFQSMLQQHLGQGAQNAGQDAGKAGKTGLSDKLVGRATELAGEMKKDHQHVTKMLETAAATGDQISMMKAMMALNDYQTKVQFVSKTISKASSSVDQLTRMQ